MEQEKVPHYVVNINELEERKQLFGQWGAHWKALTPAMKTRGGSLGVNHIRLPSGHATCPFHWHAREDEVFYILSGRGVLRYGEDLQELQPGDCISCPAGTEIAHQIGNPFEEDLCYLAIGPHDPHEVCVYPDNGKVLVRAAKTIGRLEKREYMDGEPEVPAILDLWEKKQ